MTVKDDGGPAFPLAVPVGDGLGIQHGMSLRDWFAGQALAGMLASDQVGESQWADNKDYAASFAYKMADAMLQERAK